MIKDLLVSFKDNFQEKTRNPFLGTYLMVWLLRNWELVYTIFNFDKELKLKDKVAFINDYYSHIDFIQNLATNTGWAFAILIVTYLLLSLSRIIVNLFEKQLTPLIYKYTDSKSIVLKEEYDRIRTDRDDLQTRLDLERESKSKLEKRIKALEAEIVELPKKGGESNKEKSDNGPVTINIPKDDMAEELIKELKGRGLLSEFKNTSVKMKLSEPIPNDYEPKDDFLQLGLIEHRSNHNSSSKNYVFTDDGQRVLDKIRFVKS